MISVRDLSRLYGSRTAVSGLTFGVAGGEVFGLLGPNGAGKTTTLRMLAGLLRPSGGRGSVGGHDLADGAPVRRLVGLLTETPGLYERLSPRANLEFHGRLHGMSGAEARRRADRMLERFELASRAADPVASFSRGMRQRLALARALLHEPKVLLLDEPTSGLDPEAAAGVRAVVAESAAQGATVVVSTHNLAEAERLCRRVAIVKNALLAVVDVEAARRTEQVDVQVAGGAEALLRDVQSVPGIARARLASTGALELEIEPGRDAVPDVVARLVAAGARVRAVVPRRRRLEDVYLERVGAVPLDDAGSAG